MGAADGGNPLSVAGDGEPVVDRRADTPAVDRRIARTRMAGYQQQHALAVNERIFKRSIDRLPGPFEIVPVEIDGPVRLHRSGL